MTITVFSLDFDGCLQHEQCEDFLIEDHKDKKMAQLKELKEKNILLRDFIDTIKKHTLDKEVLLHPNPIFLIGSNRQSYDTEIANKLCTGHACFEHMKELVSYFNGAFDPFLLEDLFNDKEPGFSYSRACELLTCGSRIHSLASEEEAAVEALKPCPADKNKILLVFAQIQKIANQYNTISTEEPIDYHFVDDRVDILESLHYFFTNHPFMIPANVTLNLTHYAKGEAPIHFKTSIQGVGQIQPNFAIITQEMGANPFKASENPDGQIKITPQISMTSVPFAAHFLATPLRRVRKEPQEESLVTRPALN